MIISRDANPDCRQEAVSSRTEERRNDPSSAETFPPLPRARRAASETSTCQAKIGTRSRRTRASSDFYRTPKSDSIDRARLLKVNGSRLGSLGRARCASSESSDGGSGCPRRSIAVQPRHANAKRPIATTSTWPMAGRPKDQQVGQARAFACGCAEQSFPGSTRGPPSSRMIAILSAHSGRRFGKSDRQARWNASRKMRRQALGGIEKRFGPNVAFRRGEVCQKRIGESRAMRRIFRTRRRLVPPRAHR